MGAIAVAEVVENLSRPELLTQLIAQQPQPE
jgi:hypothetical protein